MSNIVNPFMADTFGIDPEIFAPLLKKDLTQTTPPFTVTNPLKDDDFATDFDLDGEVPFLINLSKLTHNLEAGFLNPKRELSRQQWLHSSSQTSQLCFTD